MALMSSIVSVGVGVIVDVGRIGGKVKVGIAVSVGTTFAAGAHETRIKTTSKTVPMFLIFIRPCYARNCPPEWLSGSCRTGETPSRLSHISGKLCL